MIKNEHLRTLAFITFALLSLALFWYGIFLITHNELFIHFTAIFAEVTLSILVVDYYLNKVKKEATLSLYCNSRREFAFARILAPFNRVFTQYLPNADFVNLLGKYASHDAKNVNTSKFNNLAHELVQGIDDFAAQEIFTAIKDNYEFMENQPIIGVLSISEELYDAMMNFTTNCYKLLEFHQTKESEDFSDKYKVHLLLIKVIESWLYIINNFIYYWNRTGRSIRQEFKENVLQFQKEYQEKRRTTVIRNLPQLLSCTYKLKSLYSY